MCGGKKLHTVRKGAVEEKAPRRARAGCLRLFLFVPMCAQQKRRGGRGGIDTIKENRYNKNIKMLLSGAAPLMA